MWYPLFLLLPPPPASHLPPTNCHPPIVTSQLPSTNCHQPIVINRLSPTNGRPPIVTNQCHPPIVINQLSPTNCHPPCATNQLPPTNFHQPIVINQFTAHQLSIAAHQLPPLTGRRRALVFSSWSDVRPGAAAGSPPLRRRDLIGRRCALVHKFGCTPWRWPGLLGLRPGAGRGCWVSAAAPL